METTTHPITPTVHLSKEERGARGKAARKASPRSSHAEWDRSRREATPLDLLLEQETTRVPELVPIRHGRMAASPFAYYRGAALPMAADLATLPRSGLNVQLCGDAHLSNFGGFASPEREMLFDVNDFDETSTGPFEWDVKRLAASLEIAGRSRGFDSAANRRVVLRGVRAYRESMTAFAQQQKLDIWYARLNIRSFAERWGAEAGRAGMNRMEQAAAKAESKDRLKAADKLTMIVDGELRFRSDPPLLVPVEELFSNPGDAAELEATIHEGLRSYRRTLVSDRRQLLNEYRFVAIARKVVGVGSVGTRCWVALFLGQGNDDPLLIQVKEAEASVLERFTGKNATSNHGQRVVEGQRLMQAASDIFLGWERIQSPLDGVKRDFYFRQLWDAKASAVIENMAPEFLAVYGAMCAWTLARAHARAGDEVAIAAYLGATDVFDKAVADFATAYADQNEKDHQTFLRAIKDGSIPAQHDI